MGPSGGEGVVVTGLGLFALVRRPATLRRSPSGRSRARRWASFVGPRRAKLWKTADSAGPTGRARIRAHSKNQVAASPLFPHFIEPCRVSYRVGIAGLP